MFTDGNCSSFLNSTLLFQFTVPTILFIKKERDFFSLLIQFHTIVLRPSGHTTACFSILNLLCGNSPFLLVSFLKGAITVIPFNISLFPVSYTHLRAHETVLDLVCRLLLEKKKNKITKIIFSF